MAENIGTEIADGLAKAFAFLKGATVKLQNLGEKVALVLKREKALEPNFIAGVGTLTADITALVSEAEAAATSEGLNFVIDGAAYAALQKLVTDAKEFVPTVEQAVTNLK